MAGGDPSRQADVAGVVEQVGRWATARPDVLAVALAGAWARDSAGPDSDVDLVVLTAEPDAYLGGGWAAPLLGPALDVRTRRWGPLLERRFRRPGGLEVDLGFARRGAGPPSRQTPARRGWCPAGSSSSTTPPACCNGSSVRWREGRSVEA